MPPLPIGHVDEVYLLDLCTLAYQLHSQALVFPFDPYAEQVKTKGSGRGRQIFFQSINRRIQDPLAAASLHARNLRGPEELTGTNGWSTNFRLDPVLYDWDQISPVRPGLTRQNREDEGLLVYAAPAAITDRIATWRTATYDPTLPPPRFVDPTPTQRSRPNVILSAPKTNLQSTGTDSLYVFEGATGIDKLGRGMWSPMGYVLVQEDAITNAYDVVIAFRGSRSGKMRARPSLKSIGAADWVTDLDLGEDHFDAISHGTVHHGFARAIMSCVPALARCLNEIDRAKGAPPRHIFVTGHSLGGALAKCLIGVVMGGKDASFRDKYLNQDVRPGLAARNWPWFGAIVSVYGAPPVGGIRYRWHYDRNGVRTTNYVFGMDVVGSSRFQHEGRCEMLYLLSPDSVQKERAHSPDVIRRPLQRMFRSSQVNHPNKLSRDTLEPFKDHALPSDALDWFKKHVSTTAAGGDRFPPHVRDNLVLYLQVIRDCLDEKKFPTENASTDGIDIDNAIGFLQQTGAVQQNAKKAFVTLKKLSLCKREGDSGIGFARMLQAWVWLAHIETMQDWNELATLKASIGPPGVYVTEKGAA